MAQKRIRTIKPEMPRDEKFGALSRDARCLLYGLLSAADDEGRFLALPSALLGDVFPYDKDAPRNLPAWIREIEATGIVLFYEHAGNPYGAFRHWRRHQKINKPRPSEIPAPPDPVVVRENAVPAPGNVQEDSGSTPVDGTEEVVPPRGSDPIRSDPDREVVDARAGEALASIDDERLTETVAILRTAPRLEFDLELMGVFHALAMYPPPAEHVKAAHLAVSRASDPTYRTTDAARALEYAFADLAKREKQVNGIRAAGGKPPRQPKPWDGALADAMPKKEATR